MKNTANKEISSIVQTRDKLVKLRTALKNKVNNLLASYAILIKRESLSSEKGLQNVLAMSLSFGFKPKWDSVGEFGWMVLDSMRLVKDESVVIRYRATNYL